MIVLRLAQGAIAHAGVRFTEWLGLAPLLGIGLCLYYFPDLFGMVPSFKTLQAWAGEPTWCNAILIVANLRFIALFVNGYFRSFRHSPTIRFAASCFAMFLWSLITMGVYLSFRDYGGSPTGVVAYGTLLILEFRNAYSSRVDMALARGYENGRT